jgi:hypothetical protein
VLTLYVAVISINQTIIVTSATMKFTEEYMPATHRKSLGLVAESVQVFVLQGAGMQAAAYINPNQDDFNTYQNVQQSLLLRFAIAAVWFLILGLSQALWKALLVHRFAGHPLNSFIDLLFLANTSAVVMDERRSGYYLHGRNQMHHSGALTLFDCKCVAAKRNDFILSGCISTGTVAAWPQPDAPLRCADSNNTGCACALIVGGDGGGGAVAPVCAGRCLC